MMSKKNRHEYYRGKPGVKYGIYNTSAKCFQFDIREDTPMLAQARLFQKIGDDAHKWRFEPRRLPKEDVWQFILDNLKAGTYGDPKEPETLLRYWREMDAADYPNAGENVKYFKELIGKEGEQ